MNKNYFYQKIQLNLDVDAKNFFIKNDKFIIMKNKVENVLVENDKLNINQIIQKIRNSKIFFCISKINIYDNKYFIYDNNKFYCYKYINNTFTLINISKNHYNLAEYSKLIFDLFQKELNDVNSYNYYLVNRIEKDNYYNQKINEIFLSYRKKIEEYDYKILTSLAKKMLINSKNELINHISENNSFLTNTNDIKDIRIYKRLDELSNDLKNLSNFSRDDIYINNKLKINDSIKNIFTKFLDTKNKENYYKELSSNINFYYNKLLLYIIKNNLNISKYKYDNIRKKLLENPINWKNLKNTIYDEKLYKEFEYLDNANNFDIL